MVRDPNYVYDLISGLTVVQSLQRKSSGSITESFDDVVAARLALEQAEKQLFEMCVQNELIITDLPHIKMALEIAINNHQVVAISYVNKKGEYEIRNIKPTKLVGNHCIAQCFLRRDTRQFAVERIYWLMKGILSAVPCPTYAEMNFPQRRS